MMQTPDVKLIATLMKSKIARDGTLMNSSDRTSLRMYSIFLELDGILG